MTEKLISKSNIAILTTVINFSLYEKTSVFFPEGIQKYVIDGRNGMHGIHSIFSMFDKLHNKNIDWLLLADEDVLFTNANAVFSIIDKMNKEDFCICGVRDGGVIEHRIYNPEMVNTFFTIINFKQVLNIWDKNEIKKNQYILPFESKINEYQLKGEYDRNSLYEPYYCFYLWLKRKNMSFLYLDSQMLDDKISNNVLFDNQEILIHTWYARSYNKNEKHTNRINIIISSIDNISSKSKTVSDLIVFKDVFFFTRMYFRKKYKLFLIRYELVFK